MSDWNNSPADFHRLSLHTNTPDRIKQTMSGHNDTFTTDEIRPRDEPVMPNSIMVTTPYPATHFPVGLTQLDYDRDRNIRIGAYFDSIKFIESSQTFSAWIHLDAWFDSIMYSAGCTWLPISKPDRDFQHGSVAIKPNQLVQKITFGQEYVSAPKVVVWLKGFDIERNANWHLSVNATYVTTRGFTLKGEVWGGTQLYGHGMKVAWIAYPASRPNIDSGRFHTSELREWRNVRHEHSKTVTFDKGFGRAPRVYFALNRIDFTNNGNLSIKANVEGVTAQGMTLHLDSWGDAEMYSTEGQWIAIQDL